MCKKSEKQYFVQVGNRQVEVNQEVYLEIYKDWKIVFWKNAEVVLLVFPRGSQGRMT